MVGLLPLQIVLLLTSSLFVSAILQMDSKPTPKLSVISSSNQLDTIDGDSGQVVASAKLSVVENYALGMGQTSDGYRILHVLKNRTVVLSQINSVSNEINFSHQLKPNDDPDSVFKITSLTFGGDLAFFYDSDQSSIFRLDLISENVSQVLHTKDYVTAMAYEPCQWSGSDQLFYSTGSSIIRVSLHNKTSKEIKSGLKNTNSIYVDQHTRLLYWVSKNENVTNKNTFKLERSDLDGNNRELVCTSPTGRSIPVKTMSMDSKLIYFADWHNQVVWKMPKVSSTFGGECQMEVLKRYTPGKPIDLSMSDPKIDLCVYKPVREIETTKPTLKIFDQVNTSGFVEDPCQDFCYRSEDPSVEQPKCHIAKDGNPACECALGFSGTRCEVNLCTDFCLNGGICNFDADKMKPVCLCGQDFIGENCHLVRTETTGRSSVQMEDHQTQNSTKGDPESLSAGQFDYKAAFLVCFSISTLITFSLVGVLCCSLRRKRAQTVIIRKSPEVKNYSDKTRNFNKPNRTQDSTSSKAFSPKASPQNGVAFQDSAARACTNYGIVLDLEDCCQMTICEKPCYEAKFRKTTQRKNRTISTSTLDENDTNALMDNQTLS